MVAAENNIEEKEFDAIYTDYGLIMKQIAIMKEIVEQQQKNIDKFENSHFDSITVVSSNEEVAVSSKTPENDESFAKTSKGLGDIFEDEENKGCSVEDTKVSENIRNSIDDAEEKNESSYCSLLKGFMESSTLHGLPKLTDSSTWVRIIWALAIAGAITALCLQIFGLSRDYLTFGVVTEVEVKQGNMTFPTVVVCNNRPILASRLVTIPFFANFSTRVDDPMNAWKLTESLYYRYDDLTPGELYRLGSNVADTITVRTFPEEALPKIKVIPYRGSCYTILPPSGTTSMDMLFNLHRNDSIGLRLPNDYPGILIRLKDNPLAFPYTEPVFGFHAYPGLKTNAVITHEIVNRLNESYDQCQNNEQSFYDRTGIAYEKQTCVNECAFNGVLSKCRCLFRSPVKEISEFFPFWLKEVTKGKVTVPNCNRKNDWNCLSEIGKNRKYCPCKPQCQEKRYSATYKGYDILDNYDCEKSSDDLVCDMVRKWAPNSNATNEWLQTNVVVAKLTMTQKPYKIYTQKPEYPFLRFLADVGGTMGFYLGASIVTYFEVVHICIASVLYMINIVRNKF